ncbi:MAG: right-handed parallel beta-helix repeat-containing protein [Candidatus Altiarchaeota archaeon]|nr:right-handed parallel beta-helix repeat-containing protein [Candidatus Altiarchaeota archaeon]
MLMVLSALTGLAVGSQSTEFTVSSMTFPLASDYICIKSNADLVDYRGSGTAEDPYVIEGISLDDHVGSGIVIKNTDANILIRNCTLDDLSGGYEYLDRVSVRVDNAKNVRVEDCSVEGVEVEDAENMRFEDCTGEHISFSGVKDGTIKNSRIRSVLVQQIMTPDPFTEGSFDPFNVTIKPSQNCLITSCSSFEIVLLSVENSAVEGCHVEDGWLMAFSPVDVIFRDNEVVNATLEMNMPSNATFENMTLVEPRISSAGFSSEHYALNLKNSTVDGKEVFYYENQRGLELKDLDAGYVWLVNCPESRIEAVEAFGIFVVNSSDVTIEGSKIDQGGIHLAFSSDCWISNNTVNNSRAREGIKLDVGCSNNTLRQNVVTKSGRYYASGIMSSGIDTSSSEGHNTISGNVVTNAGVGLDVGRKNTIIGNTIANNAIGLRASDDHNEIAQNNFVYNGIDAQQRSTIAWKDVSFANNSWDGNFWTSYRGEDEDGDGVGDTLHVVPAGWPSSGEAEAVAEEQVVDNAPMMEPISDPAGADSS